MYLVQGCISKMMAVLRYGFWSEIESWIERRKLGAIVPANGGRKISTSTTSAVIRYV